MWGLGVEGFGLEGSGVNSISHSTRKVGTQLDLVGAIAEAGRLFK